MAEVVWVGAATDQLVAIAAYIRQFNPKAADETAAKLRSLANSLSTLPRRGRPATADTRELTSVRPYIIRYRVSADGELVIILSVRHSRRRAS
ncbi:type II toxin-antitoxin system RelE/ParE family toxin [Sphingomonas bacterium]|uniref:type II toxin-antitoxin system RelE/ParE family toxin n=1 Tax=Sphingomonas bacterium TaxID=1895847 RepID=UPI001574FA02|nr:type II toxin-antitoxin system RelE/ParE family toxin [Sphingomonas bacterium]